MNVTLPDGTTIDGVPDGTSKADLFAKLKANGHPVDESWMKPEAPAEKPMTKEEYDKGSIWEKVGGPKPGETRSDFSKKVQSVDMPFPDILPGGAMMANAVAREGGGLAGAASAIGKGAVNVAKDVLDSAGRPIKYLLRGSDKNLPAMREGIAKFQAAGAEPSVGQATGGRVPQALESLMAKTPGGAGQMAAKATQQQAAIGEKVRQTADSLAGDATPFVAGRTIEKGLTGFTTRFKDQQKELYGKVDQFIQPNNPVNVSKTAKALADMNKDIEGAEALSKFFQNGKIQDIETALKSDTSGTKAGVMIVPPNAPTAEQRAAASHGLMKKTPVEMRLGAAPRKANATTSRNPYTGKEKTVYNGLGAPPVIDATPVRGAIPSYSTGQRIPIPGGSPTNELPYDAVKKLRTLVGQEITDHSLASTVPRSKWKALYAALSDDLTGAAKATGNADAIKAVDRANAYTKAGHDRIDAVLDKVQSRGLPEEIYKAATNLSDMQAGASKIGTIMKSLTPEERDVVKSAFIRRMGTAKPGVQSAEGGIFSSQTFLTQWNQMSPQAKAVMFSGKEGNSLRENLDAVAQASSRIKDGSKVFANPSGTTPAAAQMGLAGAVGGAAVAAASGNVAPAAALITGVAGANITARLMTNPKFVGWLAAAAKLPEQQLAMRVPGLVNVLRAQTSDQQDDVKQDVENYVASIPKPGEAQ